MLWVCNSNLSCNCQNNCNNTTYNYKYWLQLIFNYNDYYAQLQHNCNISTFVTYKLQHMFNTITTTPHFNCNTYVHVFSVTYQLQHKCNTITTTPHLNCNTYVHVFIVHEIATIYNYHTIATYVSMTRICMQLQSRHTQLHHISSWPQWLWNCHHVTAQWPIHNHNELGNVESTYMI